MSRFEIKSGWMNIVWNLDDRIMLSMSVRDLKEIVQQVSDSSNKLSGDETE